jgi:hypothetical protein
MVLVCGRFIQWCNELLTLWTYFGQWSVVCGQWSVFSVQCSVFSDQWSVVGGRWSVFSGSVASGQLFMLLNAPLLRSTGFSMAGLSVLLAAVAGGGMNMADDAGGGAR